MKRALLPLGFLIAAFGMMLVLRGAPALFDVDRAQPLLVITYWQHTGSLLAAVLLAGFAIAFGGYRFAVADARNVPLWCALACVCALLAPAIFSSDVYAYAAYGSMLAHGINPYAPVTLRAGDPLLNAAQWQWGNPLPVCVYGPAFLVVARIGAVAQSFGSAAPLWFFRIVSCMALTGCAALIRRPRDAALFALNPVAVWACAEGHNDALALLILFGGLLLMRARPFAGAVLTGLSATLKAPALAAAAIAWRTAPRTRERIAAAAGCAIGASIAIASCYPLIVAALHDVAPHHRAVPHFSPMFVFWLGMPPAAAIGVTAVCALLIALAGRFRFAPLVLALWFCVPNPYPWYGLWLLAAAICTADARAQRALVLAATFASLRYAGEATGLLSPAIECAIVAAAYGIPLIALYLGTDRAGSRRPEIRTAAPSFAPHHLP